MLPVLEITKVFLILSNASHRSLVISIHRCLIWNYTWFHSTKANLDAMSHIELTRGSSYLVLTGELWGFNLEYLGLFFSRDIESAMHVLHKILLMTYLLFLYILLLCWLIVLWTINHFWIWIWIWMNQPVNIETTMKNVITETAWNHNNLQFIWKKNLQHSYTFNTLMVYTIWSCTLSLFLACTLVEITKAMAIYWT